MIVNAETLCMSSLYVNLSNILLPFGGWLDLETLASHTTTSLSSKLKVGLCFDVYFFQHLIHLVNAFIQRHI